MAPKGLVKDPEDAAHPAPTIRQIVNATRLRHLDVMATLGAFQELNRLKGYNIRDLTDYVNKDPLAPKWSVIQDEWRKISVKLQAVLATIKEQSVQLVQGAGLSNASDLGAALEPAEGL